MTVRIKLTTWCTFVVRFMRDQLAYEKVHAFQAHYQSIDQEVKKYKKDLTGKNPKAKIDEAHVTLIQGQGKKALTAVAVPKKPEASAKAKPSTASSTGASGGEETGATGEEGASADDGGGKGASADSAGDAAGETPAGGAQDDDSGAQGGGSAGDGASPKATETPGGKDGVGSTTNGELMFVLF